MKGGAFMNFSANHAQADQRTENHTEGAESL